MSTASDALKLSPAQLASRTRLAQPECVQIVQDVGARLCALPQNDTRTIAEILELDEPPDGDDQWWDEDVTTDESESKQFIKRFTTGDQVLDRLIGGGIELGSVTEVAGQS